MIVDNISCNFFKNILITYNISFHISEKISCHISENISYDISFNISSHISYNISVSHKGPTTGQSPMIVDNISDYMSHALSCHNKRQLDNTNNEFLTMNMLCRGLLPQEPHTFIIN